MKTITQITEEKQDKVLQSPMLAQVIMKLKNALLASDKFKEIESMYNKLSNKSFFNKNDHKQYFDNIKNIKSNND